VVAFRRECFSEGLSPARTEVNTMQDEQTVVPRQCIIPRLCLHPTAALNECPLKSFMRPTKTRFEGAAGFSVAKSPSRQVWADAHFGPESGANLMLSIRSYNAHTAVLLERPVQSARWRLCVNLDNFPIADHPAMAPPCGLNRRDRTPVIGSVKLTISRRNLV